jgi:hypothetical protein
MDDGHGDTIGGGPPGFRITSCAHAYGDRWVLRLEETANTKAA